MNTQNIDKRLYFEPRYNKSNNQISWRLITCGYIGMYRWEIYSNGMYPAMYIKLPNNHPLRKITDADYLENFITGPNNITYWDGEIVGWDFGHFNDYRHGDTTYEGKTMHTVMELKRELKVLIQQCQKIENNPEAIEAIENTVEEILDKREKERERFLNDEYYEYEGLYNESKNYSKMSKKNTIRLTESDLKRVISESVKRVLKEGYEDPDFTNEFGEIVDALNQVRQGVIGKYLHKCKILPGGYFGMKERLESISSLINQAISIAMSAHEQD